VLTVKKKNCTAPCFHPVTPRAQHVFKLISFL
jgi:hypothetical protein